MITAPHPARVVVVGAAARDLVLQIPRMPAAGGSVPVEDRIERLGGKGANIAAGIRQLSPATVVTLIGVLGTDPAGEMAVRDATELGINLTHLIRRGQSALLVDLVDETGERRLFEQVPGEALLTREDVAGAAATFRAADVVVLQLQQPPDVLLTAATIAHDAGAVIVLDGAVTGDAREALLTMATVVRADSREGEILTGRQLRTASDARLAATSLLERGPNTVALSVPEVGDVVAWPAALVLATISLLVKSKKRTLGAIAVIISVIGGAASVTVATTVLAAPVDAAQLPQPHGSTTSSAPI